MSHFKRNLIFGMFAVLTMGLSAAPLRAEEPHVDSAALENMSKMLHQDSLLHRATVYRSPSIRSMSCF